MKVLLCPLTSGGFMYPAIAAGLELRRRGQCVHLLGEDAVVRGCGLPFVRAQEYGPRGSLAVNRWHRRGHEQYQTVARAAADLGADVLVTSVLCHGALLAGEVLDLPVVVIGLAAYLWQYQTGAESDPRHRAERAWRTFGMLRFYRQVREQAGLGARDGFPLTGDAHILRGDPAFECPDATLPSCVQYAGPCGWEPAADPAEVSEVTEHVDRVGKPVVYVHLGRVFNGPSMWPALNVAFTDGPFQAVVELGRSPDEVPAPGADIVVVRKPWMMPLIQRAELVLTSATSAPVVNALLQGRPLAVSPVGSEQPLLARACVRAGVAVYLPGRDGAAWSATLSSASPDRELRDHAAALGDRLARAGGSSRAADIIAAAAGMADPADGADGPAELRPAAASSRA
jgi:UDP:flavonoid glycosyltransferase YjiC (YdhE family)